MDGQVGQLFIADRTNVSRDAKLLSVIDLSALEVQMQVAESFARELQPGMPGEIAGNGQRWAGQVSSVSPEVVNGEVSARLRFDGQQPEQLRQNQRLSVRVLLDRRDKVLGSSLEAEVWVPSGEDSDFLAELFITSTVHKGDEIKVTKTSNRKCGRCWRHMPGVSEDGGLDARCAEVLRG